LHGGEQLRQALVRRSGVAAVVDQPLEHAAGQQAHVFGKKAEQALREEVRHLVGALLGCGLWRFGRARPRCAQLLGQGGKAAGGGFGDVAVGLRGLKLSGAVQMRRSSAQIGGLVQLGNAHLVRLAGVAGELGVDADVSRSTPPAAAGWPAPGCR
jgi:hypothetical protein